MPHPMMFDPDNPMLEQVRSLALAFPEAREKISHGHPTFFTTKVFASYGSSVRRDDGSYESHPRALAVRPSVDERLALLDAGAWAPPYLGPSGWVSVDLAGPWLDRIEELLDMSYRNTATARLLRML